MKETNKEYAKTNNRFKTCCLACTCEPTKRQASKFRSGKGSAFNIGLPIVKKQYQKEEREHKNKALDILEAKTMLKENIEEVLNKKNNHVNSFELYLDDKLIDYFEDMTTSQIKACIANIGYHNFNNAIFYLCRGTNVFYAVSVDINNIEYTEN